MIKNEDFGQNFAVLGSHILVFTGVSKSFGTHVTEKTPRQLVRIVFRSGVEPNEPKMPKDLAKNAKIWPKFGRLGQKIHIMGGGGGLE